jgi:hypothetical protein
LLFDFLLQVLIFRLQLLNTQLQSIHLLLSTYAEFLDDLKEAPETENDNQRGDLLENAVQENVNDEACYDDSCVEAVEPGIEISKDLSSLLIQVLAV